MIRTGAERRICPQEYQDYLVHLFGINRFGKPNFRLVWGQTRTEILGGLWEKPDGTKQAGMRESLKYWNDPCWYLERWLPPEEYGSPAKWYEDNRDPGGTGLSLLGPYPQEGEYEVCYTLNNGVEPNYLFIDTWVKCIVDARRYTKGENKAARDRIRAAKDRAENNSFNDAIDNRKPAFGGNTSSFAGQGNRNSPLERVKLTMSAEELHRTTGLGKGFQVQD